MKNKSSIIKDKMEKIIPNPKFIILISGSGFGIISTGFGIKKNRHLPFLYFFVLFNLPFMDLIVFQELTEQITLECFFMTDSQQEEKVIQLIDLHHFIECYNPGIKIHKGIHHSINIIEENGNKKGILFYDCKYSASVDPYDCEAFKKLHQLQEIWFVFVEEDANNHPNRHIDFIIENSLEIFYDRIFLFNFFQSVIHTLK